MNVYDFDKTIYHRNSTADFLFYCLRRHPRILKCLPGQLWGFLLYGLKIIDITEMKRHLYSFLPLLDDVDGDLEDFWDKNIERVHGWYLQKHRDDDLVISGSPQFLVEGACRRLFISHLVASDVDRKTGEVRRPNCSRAQKITEMERAGYDRSQIEEFYSDSHSDDPLAALAQKAWLVKGESLEEWGRTADGTDR
ncbi:MAG: haloacid dehalogenase-like hydrolase [Erysipelotrichaceae bacterium]|nr:haloacid dehalogenase-like hydrolase [Erysipelotrichaceae bacterium]MBR5048914.1 haloacid dehalogenase-like hydrolase [Erysipelotrichaceae bacterium]